jgi:hypothetical protein
MPLPGSLVEKHNAEHNEDLTKGGNDRYHLHPQDAVRVRACPASGQSWPIADAHLPQQAAGRIVPLKEEQALAEDDSIFRLEELAEPIGPLRNAQIDALVYGQ